MLQISDIETYYGKLQVLKGVSFNVPKHEITSLLGGNGSGKSTALKSVIGMVSPAKGRIEYENKKINGFPPEKIIKMGISLIPQGREIFPKMSVVENLEMGAFIRKDYSKIKEDMKGAFRMFPILETRRKQVAGTLSGGEQQMLAICRGLMSRPKLLLMDEPSAGLAPRLVKEIFSVIESLNREGMTILIVEQNVGAALSISNFTHILRNGEIVVSERSKNLLDNPDLKSAYLGG